MRILRLTLGTVLGVCIVLGISSSKAAATSCRLLYADRVQQLDLFGPPGHPAHSSSRPEDTGNSANPPSLEHGPFLFREMNPRPLPDWQQRAQVARPEAERDRGRSEPEPIYERSTPLPEVVSQAIRAATNEDLGRPLEDAPYRNSLLVHASAGWLERGPFVREVLKRVERANSGVLLEPAYEIAPFKVAPYKILEVDSKELPLVHGERRRVHYSFEGPEVNGPDGRRRVRFRQINRYRRHHREGLEARNFPLEFRGVIREIEIRGVVESGLIKIRHRIGVSERSLEIQIIGMVGMSSKWSRFSVKLTSTGEHAAVMESLISLLSLQNEIYWRPNFGEILYQMLGEIAPHNVRIYDTESGKEPITEGLPTNFRDAVDQFFPSLINS